jgi:lysophospholipase L1-like esterase
MQNRRLSRWGLVPFSLALLFSLFIAPVAFAHSSRALAVVGPKSHYLALGDSLAFGFQPDLDFVHGYDHYFFANLKTHGVKDDVNMGCPGETSVTMLSGKCPYSYLRKYPYVGSQLTAALIYLTLNRGSVSPVTLDIGANDVLPDIDTKTCTIDTTKFASDLATVDTNLRQTILPQLHQALLVNGNVSGDLVVMNYYDAYQNICPNTVPYVQEVNSHIAADAQGYAQVADVFSAFGGATSPNPAICTYTWMCSAFQNIHGTDQGYQEMANTFENTLGY